MEHASAAVPQRAVTRPLRLLRMASDERLVAFAREGDERAFEAIYDRHHRAILSFCRHMLGTREEAEDAVQHTFLAAYRDLTGSSKPIELRPWLFAIARNRCLSMLRARRPQLPLDVAEPATDGLAATVERREDVRELLGDLARLPDDQRAALLLSELGALDHAGIAAVLGCRTEKVKALVFQARSSLGASREARATPCAEIREQLATATGAALRRGALRRHLRDCPGCRAFRSEVARQRSLLAIALPVLPTAALKGSVLAGLASGGGGGTGALGGAGAGAHAVATAGGGAAAGGAAAGGGGVLATIASAGAAKVAVSLAIAGAVAGGSALTYHAVRDATTTPDRPAVVAPQPGTTPAATGSNGATPAGTPPVAGTTPPRSSRAQGVLPERAAGTGGNRAAAHAHARSRGGQAGGSSTGATHRQASHPVKEHVTPTPRSGGGGSGGAGKPQGGTTDGGTPATGGGKANGSTRKQAAGTAPASTAPATTTPATTTPSGGQTHAHTTATTPLATP